MNNNVNNPHKGKDINIYIPLGLFFLVTFGYFCLIGNYVLFFQEIQSLFVFSGEYLRKHMSKPGALLEYAAKFLTQFYHGRIAGTIILSVVLTIPGILLHFINKRLIPGNTFSLLFLLIPSCLMLIMQANYYHMMEYNLGFLIILSYYLFFVTSVRKYRRMLVLILFPLFYYLAGSYALIFILLYITHVIFFGETKHRFVYPVILVVIAAISFFISWKVLFLQPVEHFIYYPLPLLENTTYRITFIILVGYLIMYPLICRVAIRINQINTNAKFYTVTSVLFTGALSIFILFKTYNPQTARVIELQKLIFTEKWDKAIRFQEEKPSRNLIGQYYYNIALSETNQLCDRLFFGSQDFLAGSLVLPWSDAHLNRGAYFYYTIGLMNEAHRWAYEEMVIYGYRPQNIKLLAKTSLINGDYRMAMKYINILKKTVYYRGWAIKYGKMADNPGLIKSDPELGEKSRILPKNNFLIQFNEPQNNLPFILEGQPDNRNAIEYYLAGLLLTKKVEIAVTNIKNLKASGYTRIPRHIEEAALMYYNSTGNFPDLGGLAISRETLIRFDQYFASYVSARKYPATLKENMQKQFGNTFWYYFHFK